MKLVYVLGALALACIVTAAALLILPEKETLTVSGLVQAKEFKNASKVGGRVLEVLVHEGETVKSGQKLVVFDDTEIQGQVLQAKAALTQAEAKQRMVLAGPDREDIRQAYSRVQQAQQSLNLSRRGADRNELAQVTAKIEAAQHSYQTAQTAVDNAAPLLEEGVISQQKYDEMQAQLKTSEAGLKSAQSLKQKMLGGAPAEQVNIARSQLGEAQAVYEKVAKGARKGDVDIAMANVDKARGHLKMAEAALSESVLTAPFAGLVQVINIEQGQLVPPGRPVISLIDETNLWSDVYLPESQLAFARPNQQVKVVSSSNGATYKGRVAFVSPKSEYVPGRGNLV
ncbi:MAG: HlyD family efflux transporter periplasmic adaptor subunit, partial [Vampirovibrio sp.]|nr:HlyD family efflux transporter periplasmic adaptor subunit [Vampirovibrio sp.]